MDNKVLEVRRAIFDFALLSVLIQLFLAFVYPDNRYYYLYLLLPHLAIVISTKSKSAYIYPFAIAFAVASIAIDIFQGIYLDSLREWGTFFYLGYSLHFSELSDLLLFLNFTGIIYFSVKGFILKREAHFKNRSGS